MPNDFTDYNGSVMKCSNTKALTPWYYLLVTLLLPTK